MSSVISDAYVIDTGDASATLTVPSGKVASTLTNFVTRVDLSSMPSGWWAAVAADGADVRVRAAGVDIPFDLVRINKPAKGGELFFKATLTTSANVFTVEVVSGATAPAATDTIGRNAVWADYDSVFVFDTFTDRTGSGRDATTGGSAYTTGPVAASPNVDVSGQELQGIAADASGNFYVFGTNRLRKYDSAWTLLADNTNPCGDANTALGISSLDHVNDGCVVDDEIFVMVHHDIGDPGSSTATITQYVTVWDTTTLALKRTYNLSADVATSASMCYNPDDGDFYIATYYYNHDKLYRYTSSFVAAGTLTLANTNASAKQGLAYANGYFYAACATKNVAEGRVYKIPSDGSAATLLWRSKMQDSSSAFAEGIHCDPLSGDLYLAYNTGTSSGYVYTLRKGWLATAGVDYYGYAVSSGVPKRTVWTMGASVFNTLAIGANSRNILSYNTSTGTSNAAALIGTPSSGPRFSHWNSTDGHLGFTTPTPDAVIRQRHRLHATQNGTTDRKIWYDGTLKATDTGAAQRPAGTPVNLFMGDGASDNITDSWYGAMNYVYLRNGVLSADWLAAEVTSWETPSSFYAVT